MRGPRRLAADRRLVTAAGTVGLRLPRRRDGRAWVRDRATDRAELVRWEATPPVDWDRANGRPAWRATRARLVGDFRRGVTVPAVIIVDGEFAGQVTLGSVVGGAMSSAWIGYWVSSRVAGRGVATAATALLADHAYREIGLHRVWATVRPENAASRRVLDRCGFREEGLLRRYLHVDGAWRDHLLVARTAGEVRGGVAAELVAAGFASFV